MPLTVVAWLEVEMLELNSQKWIYSFLLRAHILVCWFFGPSNFNTIRDLSRDLRLPVEGEEKSYPSRERGFYGAVIPFRRSQCSRSLRCGSAAARLLG